MGDVLTKEEREFVDGFRSWFKSGGSAGQPTDGRFICLINRLTSEVERLRSELNDARRGALLEAAAKCDEEAGGRDVHGVLETVAGAIKEQEVARTCRELAGRIRAMVPGDQCRPLSDVIDQR